MGLSEISKPQSILAAIEECEALGRENFLAKYGFQTGADLLP
jgi:hypothetical protein